MSHKSFTLRLPPELYERIVAKKRKSLTEFVIQAVAEKLDQEREEERQRGFATLVDNIDVEEYDLWAGVQGSAMNRIDD